MITIFDLYREKIEFDCKEGHQYLGMYFGQNHYALSEEKEYVVD